MQELGKHKMRDGVQHRCKKRFLRFSFLPRF